MKIKTKEMTLEEALALPLPPHKKPVKPILPLRLLLKAASAGDLKATDFRLNKGDMKDSENQPSLILMNHSSFIDLEIASTILYPRPFNIVCTSDGFVGKAGLMYAIGCIPTRKFVTDISLVSDIRCALKENQCSVLMYPEASYTFDGTATPLPRGLGILLKRLDVPVIMIRTHGAFARDPLYNCLQKRNVKVSTDMYCLFSREELKTMTAPELDAKLDEAFTFDHFAEQKAQGIRITEPFRADGLNRILFRCCECGRDGEMEGRGTSLCCRSCGAQWTLEEDGTLAAKTGESRYGHIPDWYAWERSEVRRELESGTYRLETKVKIGIMRDFSAIGMVGEGTLTQTGEGFILEGCGGRLHYEQGPLSAYSCYSDYYWYEIGDMICIGDNETLYYCFPEQRDVAAKARMAAEELYKMKKSPRRRRRSAGAETE